MKRVWRLVIPADVVSQNTINSWFRAPNKKVKWKYAGYKKRFDDHIWGQTFRKEPARPTKKRLVQYFRIIPPRGRKFDADGFVGGLKPVQDSLKKNNLIHDDSETWINTEHYQIKNSFEMNLRAVNEEDTLGENWHGLIIEIFEEEENDE